MMKTEKLLTQRREDAKPQKKYLNNFAPMRLCAFALILFVFNFAIFAQETPPAPSAPKSVKIPTVKAKTLPNKLQVVVVERKNVPLVTVQLLVKAGAEMESSAKAGLANMTASLLTKGTTTRTATQIAEQMEFLGGSIDTGAGWNNSVVTINVMADKLDQAMTILADTVLNPAFKQDEIDLLKTQTLDGLNFNLTQPGFLASYVASAYSFNEHPAGGTPESINAIKRDDIVKFQKDYFQPQNSVLIFTGDITDVKASELAQKYFGNWKSPSKQGIRTVIGSFLNKQEKIVNRILVVDLPNSGQAAVSYATKLTNIGRTKEDSYFPASVLNSILGGGYSSRLNQEIRIKRGLSYGAGSSFAWREYKSNFGTRTQTKNESAAEVAELVVAEIKKLTDTKAANTELSPRKLVLTGTFGRNLETTGGLAAAIADLYSFGLPTSELDSYMKNVNAVSDVQIQSFAGENLNGGDIIIVGDAKIFMDDLKKRFPNQRIEVVKADELDLSKANLMKAK